MNNQLYNALLKLLTDTNDVAHFAHDEYELDLAAQLYKVAREVSKLALEYQP